MSLAREIHVAAEQRQADLVLKLYQRGSGCHASGYGEGWLDAAHAVIDLALRLRLPHGRQGAWAKHLHLLQVVCALLEYGMAVNGDHPTEPAVEALLLRARRLQGHRAA